MACPYEFAEQKAELEAVLASGIFDRAPSMARLLQYVCSKYFEGQQAQVKEYTIAVEALGRPPDFDPGQDSIVRVEAHRLRARLKKFYETDGATHKVKIVLPAGQYIPQFVVNHQESSPMNEPADAGDTGKSASESQSDSFWMQPVSGSFSKVIQKSPRRRSKWWSLVTVLALTACGMAVWLVLARPRFAAGPTISGPVIPNGQEIRILAGRTAGSYTDCFGRVWQPDRYFTGGYVTNYAGHPVRGTLDPGLYQTAREGDFQYDIPLPPGNYELRLYFAELLFGEENVGGGGEGMRVFNVDANGRRLLSFFDVIADAAGANVANERVFKDVAPDADGYLHLRFTHLIRDAFVNAIEIRPGTPGKLRPIRIVMSNSSYLDRAGQLWERDHYYQGGQLLSRPQTVSGTYEPSLYRSQRCGNITYVIPVAPSTYAMTLRFAEGWWGAGHPFPGGAGSRIFNIICNSQMLARNFDIYKEAGGPLRAVERTFHGLQPSPQGKLVLHLQPVVHYACVNAIEILDEGR